MITLKSDNRQLLQNAKFSYLNTNYASGVTSLVVTSGLDFATNDYVLLGNFGSETAEIRKISNVSTNTLTVDTTLFAHAESTKVTVIKYNQIQFYHTTTEALALAFDDSDPIDNGAVGAGYINIQADNFLTYGYDSTNTTGFGFFKFYNSTTVKWTTGSNPIPYAGFGENSVKKVFDSFFSQLNNKELKLITNEDAFRWLNEGYSIMRNELNLTNDEYTVPADDTISAVSGTAEYDLPTGFSDVVSIWYGTDKVYLDSISLSEVDEWDSSTANTTKYYLRGTKIGFSPEPTASRSYSLKYKKTGSTLNSYYDSIEIPDNNFYPIINFMMYRAAPKLKRGDGNNFLELFKEAVAAMKVISHKRDNEKDSWDLEGTTNV